MDMDNTSLWDSLREYILNTYNSITKVHKLYKF
jgi:hypothetical protein